MGDGDEQNTNSAPEGEQNIQAEAKAELKAKNEEVKKLTEINKDLKGKLKQKIDNGIENTKELAENVVNQLGPVKIRTMARRKQLMKAMAHKHKKEIIHGHAIWKDSPPRKLIGGVTVLISGGIGKVRYVEYLKNPKTGYAIKEASADGVALGGNIISHYVEELLEPGKPIKIDKIKVAGVPTAEEAAEREQNARKRERARVNKIRGITN